MNPQGRNPQLPFLADDRLLASKARLESDEELREDLFALMATVSKGMTPYTDQSQAEAEAFENLLRHDSVLWANKVSWNPRQRAQRLGEAHAVHFQGLFAAQQACAAITEGADNADAFRRDPLLLRFALWAKAEISERKTKLHEMPVLNALVLAATWPFRMAARTSRFLVLPLMALAMGVTRPLLHMLTMLERSAVEAHQQGGAGWLTSLYLGFARLKHTPADEMGTGVRPIFWEDVSGDHGFGITPDQAKACYGSPRRCLMTFMRHPLACHELALWEKGHSENAPWLSNPRSGRYFWAASVLVIIYLAGFVALLPATWPFVLARAIGKPLVEKAA